MATSKDGTGRPWRGKGQARALVQGAFLVLCIWIGFDFWRFMNGSAPHPPGAEGFLPISALLSLKFWLISGRIHPAHPAGLFIFLAILGLGFLLRKAFCSWLCPVGTLSEALWKLGRRPFGRNLAPPKWVDYPLRSIKYLSLAFVLWAVLGMDGPALEAFLASPFNVGADVRMYFFFTRISGLALGVILALAVLSVVIQNFWCRYLCPYGALLGFLSLGSPVRVTRTQATCIDCGLCTRACPSRIQVHRATGVHSDECTACLRCVEACPVKDTLQMRAPGGMALPPKVFGLLVVALFAAVTGLAMATGHWDNKVPPRAYRQVIHEAVQAREP